jgi:hypothetical protein
VHEPVERAAGIAGGERLHCRVHGGRDELLVGRAVQVSAGAGSSKVKLGRQAGPVPGQLQPVQAAGGVPDPVRGAERVLTAGGVPGVTGQSQVPAGGVVSR